MTLRLFCAVRYSANNAPYQITRSGDLTTEDGRSGTPKGERESRRHALAERFRQEQAVRDAVRDARADARARANLLPIVPNRNNSNNNGVGMNNNNNGNPTDGIQVVITGIPVQGNETANVSPRRVSNGVTEVNGNATVNGSPVPRR
jgi:hypothetical protein